MSFKIVTVTLALLVAVASAAPQAYHAAAPAYGYAQKGVDADYDSNAEYNFAYEVHDDHTGDIKSQQESRHGDVVVGSYTLIEADGTRRIVEYKADDHSGFNAVVRKEGEPHAPIVKKYVSAPVAPQQYHSQPAAPAYNHGPLYGYHH